MAADVFESYEVTLVAAIILAAATLLDPAFTQRYGEQASAFALKLVLFPLLVRAVGVFSSMLGIWSVRMRGEHVKDPMRPITVGYWVSGGEFRRRIRASECCLCSGSGDGTAGFPVLPRHEHRDRAGACDALDHQSVHASG